LCIAYSLVKKCIKTQQTNTGPKELEADVVRKSRSSLFESTD
jgi:hypothetical protein